MTEKQRIIDGVDVSECPYYIHKDGSCSSHDCECIKCIHNVCFYKDYKAKEQECEELKKQYNCYACGTCKGKEDYKNLETHHIGLRKSFDKLHEQLDQLKAQNETYKKMFENEDVRLALNEIRTGERHLWVNKAEKLKQTLSEIKKIAEQISLPMGTGNGGNRVILAKTILQKISEAENE